MKQMLLIKIEIVNGEMNMNSIWESGPEQQTSLKKGLLQSDSIYILDCGSELFLWFGRKSPNHLREVARVILGELFSLFPSNLFANTGNRAV